MGSLPLSLEPDLVLRRICCYYGPDVMWASEGRKFQLQDLPRGRRLVGCVEERPGGCLVTWERKRPPFPLAVLVPAVLGAVLLALAFWLGLRWVRVGIGWLPALLLWCKETQDDDLDRILEERLLRP